MDASRLPLLLAALYALAVCIAVVVMGRRLVRDVTELGRARAAGEHLAEIDPR